MTALESVQTTGNEKIKGIIKGYSEIVIDCLDEKKKKEFEMDPIPRLR
ncbi:MAG: hypothetical protein GY754_05325, partial [bacterium]|nr:hypothetical protein [bacterium]